MKRSVTRLTMVLATAGVLSLPVTSFARTTQEQQPQQPKPTQPQPQQPQPAQPQPAQPQPSEPQPTQQPTASASQPQTEQAVSPQEHLRQAKEAANGISATSVPAENRAALTDLKRHLTTLERLGSSNATPTESTRGTSARVNWGTEVAAIDKIISDIVGSDTSSPTTPSPTGTSGSTSKASSTTIDDATRAKLMEVRTHLTAYAAGMSASSSTPKSEAATSADPTAAQPAHSEPSMTSSTTQTQPAAPASPSQNPAPTQPAPSATQGAAAQTPAAAQPPTAAQPQGNTEAAHRHLVTARETLSQLTQLPAAGQLSGEARTQVWQLITNFNELISNPPDWHASYQKVAANLTALLGPDNSDSEATAGAPTTSTDATATPGAVGTTGSATTELDPAIRAKLLELRKNLNDFQKAAGK